ncbi:MAG: hypothetical protein IJU21_03715, partial [Bacteroidales bacterium]|nr:hypothetical protein [Bacteroidales bacterium]
RCPHGKEISLFPKKRCRVGAKNAIIGNLAANTAGAGRANPKLKARHGGAEYGVGMGGVFYPHREEPGKTHHVALEVLLEGVGAL